MNFGICFIFVLLCCCWYCCVPCRRKWLSRLLPRCDTTETRTRNIQKTGRTSSTRCIWTTMKIWSLSVVFMNSSKVLMIHLNLTMQGTHFLWLPLTQSKPSPPSQNANCWRESPPWMWFWRDVDWAARHWSEHGLCVQLPDGQGPHHHRHDRGLPHQGCPLQQYSLLHSNAGRYGP